LIINKEPIKGQMGQLPKASRAMRKFIIILLIIVASVVTIEGLFLLSLKIRFWQQRYRECDPGIILPSLERAFGVNFPEVKIKAAKAHLFDGQESDLYLLKFASEPEEVEQLIDSLDKNEKITVFCEPPDKDSDVPIQDLIPKRDWLPRRPMTQGKMYYIKGLKIDMTIYIDTTNENKYTVYVKGDY